MIAMTTRCLTKDEAVRAAEDAAALLPGEGRALAPSAPAVRLSIGADGFWYLDVRRTAAGAFRSDSRHASIDEALARVKEVAGCDLQRKSGGRAC